MATQVRGLLNAACFAVLLAPVLVGAQDLGILWDVSKSVPGELYGGQVRSTVDRLLRGEGAPDGWVVTKPTPSHAVLDDIISGKRPALKVPSRVLFVRFGTAMRNSNVIQNLPFDATELSVVNAADGLKNVAALYPGMATDDWTNKQLAEAAAARYFFDRGSTEWLLLIVSDFNEDNKDSLLPAEAAFVDSYEAQQFATVSPIAVLRLEANARVLLKVKYAVARQTDATALPTLPSRRPLEGVAPAAAATIDSTQPTFSWRFNGKTAPSAYELVITAVDRPGERPVREKSTTMTARPRLPLKPGNYRWQVAAVTEGSQVSSESRSFTIKGGASATPLILLGLAAATVGAVLYLNRWKKAQASTAQKVAARRSP